MIIIKYLTMAIIEGIACRYLLNFSLSSTKITLIIVPFNKLIRSEYKVLNCIAIKITYSMIMHRCSNIHRERCLIFISNSELI